MSNCIQKVKFHSKESETKLNKTPITFKIRENIKNIPTLEAKKGWPLTKCCLVSFCLKTDVFI